VHISPLLQRTLKLHFVVVALRSRPLIWPRTRTRHLQVGRRFKMVNMTFVDFLEALGRIAVFKPLPTQEDYLEVYKQTEGAVEIEDCAKFFDHLVVSGGDFAVFKFNEAHDRDWQVDETLAGRPLPESYGLVCQLIIGRLDRDGDGQISRKDWKFRRASGGHEKEQAKALAAADAARSKNKAAKGKTSDNPNMDTNLTHRPRDWRKGDEM